VYRFCSLFREMFPYAVSQTHLEELKIQPVLNAEYRDATFSICVKPMMETGWQVKASLVNPSVHIM